MNARNEVLVWWAALPLIVGLAVALPARAADSHDAERWKTLQFADGIVVEYRPHLSDVAHTTADHVRFARRRFHALSDTIFPIPVRVILAASDIEFAKLTRNLLPDWGGAVAVPAEGLIIVPAVSGGKSLSEAVHHETAHLAMHVLSRSAVPRWFDEGIAMQISDEWDIGYSLRLARSALANRLLPLNSIERVLSFEQDHASLAYSESFAASRWLSQRYGEDVVPRLLRLLPYVSFEEALEKVTGESTASFERKWLQSARSSYALAGLADDMWIWSILIPGLFFLALGVRWWRNRRTIERWKKEDWDGGPPDKPLDEKVSDTY